MHLSSADLVDEPYGAVAALTRLLTEHGREAVPPVLAALEQALSARVVLREMSSGLGRQAPPTRREPRLDVPLRAAGVLVGVLTIHGALPASSAWLADDGTSGPLTLLADVLALTLAARPLTDRAAVARLLSVEEDERAALAESVHESLVRSLVAARYLTEQVLSDGDDRGQSISAVRQSIGTALADVRRLLARLRVRGRDGLSLVPALQDLARSAGSGVRVTVGAEIGPLPAAEALAAYRFVQAAMDEFAEGGAGGLGIEVDAAGVGFTVSVLRRHRLDACAAALPELAGESLRRAAARVELLGGTTRLNGDAAHAWLPVADRRSVPRAAGQSSEGKP